MPTKTAAFHSGFFVKSYTISLGNFVAVNYIIIWVRIYCIVHFVGVAGMK